MLCTEKKRLIKFLFLLILTTLIIAGIIGLIYSLYKLQKKNVTEDALGVQRDYSILITGSSNNESFLRQIYEGASIVSNFYDCATQYYVPEKKLENRSDQFYYAGFSNPNCVIAYLDSNFENLYQPRTIDGKAIPLITVGSYFSNIKNLFHIGLDYDELAEKMSRKVLDFFGQENGTLYILDIERKNNFFVNHLYERIIEILNSKKNNITIYNSVVAREEIQKSERGLSIEDEVRQQLASLGKVDLILALSEQNTLLAVQSSLDLNIHSQTKIIGFGEGQESLTYLKKGFVSELFCADAIDIGKKAMQHFFEYKTTGSTENYFVADIKVLKSEMDLLNTNSEFNESSLNEEN